MKTIIQRIVLLAIMSLTGLTASAYDFESNGIYYKITSMSDLEVEVCSNGNYEEVRINYDWVWKNTTSYKGYLIIPATVNYNNRTFTVTGIGKAAFGYPYRADRIDDDSYDRATNSATPTEITSIKLPQTIRHIDAMAFQGCNIQSIELPNSLTTIGTAAFAYTKLTSISIPSSVTQINKQAFYGSDIQSVILGKNVSSIGSAAFQYCASLLEVFCTSNSLPTGLSTTTFSYSHSALEIYVPSKAVYGFGKEYLSFTSKTFQYSGAPQNIEWKNNLKAYKCGISEADCKTDINAGTYTKQLLAQYSDGVDFSVEIPYEYTITKAPLSMIVEDAQREYGDPNPTFAYQLSGFVNGDSEQTLGITPSFDCEATQKSDVGDYRILASLNAPNYETTYTYGTLTITKAPLTISIKNATKIYGEKNPQFAFTYIGLKNGDSTISWTVSPTFNTTADAKSPVGEYAVSAVGGEAKNYNITSRLPGLLTITKRTLTVKADDCERLYGEANPNFTITYTGFANIDSSNSLQSVPQAKCAATEASNAGTYAITVSGGSSTNYEFVYKNGNLVIKPVPVGFKDVYNSVSYNDMSVSTSDNYFNYIPEITGPFSKDDFWIELWYLDGDNSSKNHVATITSGEYAGNYVNTNADREMWAGKYIFTLTSKGTNPNVVANPSRSYLTVNKASNNLTFETADPIKVKIGETLDIGITYQADLWCKFNTDFNENIISLSSVAATSNNPHWFVTGLKEGETTLSFSIDCLKNDMGFYNFSGTNTIKKRIIVEPGSGVEGVVADNDSITIKVVNGQIVVNNAPANSTIRIFNIQGILLAETTDSVIDGLTKGIYIVSVGNKSFKVAL